MNTFQRLKLSSPAQELEFDSEIPERFWYRRPRLQGQDSGGWEPVSTQNGTVTIRTRSPVPAASDVYVPGIAKVRIAQFLPQERILVVEHRLSLTPPRSIYAAYFPIRLHQEWLNLTRCAGANPDCLSPGEWVGATGSAGITQPEYFYVRFSDRAQIGRSEFRPEFRTAPPPSPARRGRQVEPPVPTRPVTPQTPSPNPAPSPPATSPSLIETFQRMIRNQRPTPPRFVKPPEISWPTLAKILYDLRSGYRGGLNPWLQGAALVIQNYWRMLNESYELALFLCSSVGYADALARMTLSNSSSISCQIPADMVNYKGGAMFYTAGRKGYYASGCRRAQALLARTPTQQRQIFLRYLRDTYSSNRANIREGILRQFMPEVSNPNLLFH